MTIKRATILGTSILALALSACGGSSSGSPAAPPGGQTGSGISWTQGVFEPAGTFKDFCEMPRSGTNDVAGSYLHEKHWLRSWSNETYLWYNEITDINPASTTYPHPLDYFDILRTDATTASGAPKDRFHFTYDTEEYEQLVSSGASAGYGARIRILNGTPPDREIVIAYVENNSPASNAGIARGTEILEVDGESVATGDADTLNAGLFPESDGESHTFLVRHNGSGTTTTITMTSDIVASDPVLTTTMDTLGNGETVGYMLFNTFGTSGAEAALFNNVRNFAQAGVDHLVLDLRYNGGGFLDIASELGYMVAGPSNTNGRVFETLVFNDQHPTFNPVTGERISPSPFHSTGQGFSVSTGTALPTLNLDKVYILSTGSTCSASESLINALVGINVDVVLIGTTSCGKPYGFYATDNCGITYFTIQFRGENDVGFGDYADGFSPFEGAATTGEPVDGCIITDDFTKSLGDSSEAMYAAALTHLETGNCPAAPDAQPDSFVTYAKPATFEDGNLEADPRIANRNMVLNSRILNRPE
ncbi:MAG: PDZ domain-containing protein [Hellea sp.]|nr:PDZ domain-containing protein [Hellea sp.]